ncbi:MAG: hypothetical protein IMZ54_04815 [Acidobacteria bacterium]|nr:hypothetical protein [Acidobacteriota bacterium]
MTTLTEDLTALLATVKAEVEECGPELALVFLNPGIDVAWDVCCGGQLWIRVVRMHPVNPLPSKAFPSSACGYPLGVQIAIGVIRCQTGLEILDTPEPKPAQFDTFGTQLTGDAEQMLLDMAAIYRVLCEAGIMIDQWNPLGPKGGCYGGEWTAWLEDFNLPDCGEESE